MIDFTGTDYFTDASLVEDPYGYYEFLRAQGPVCREPYQGTCAVTGYEACRRRTMPGSDRFFSRRIEQLHLQFEPRR